MSAFTINFTGGTSYVINIARSEAEQLIKGLTAGTGFTTINSLDGLAVINRDHFTYAVFKEPTK